MTRDTAVGLAAMTIAVACLAAILVTVDRYEPPMYEYSTECLETETDLVPMHLPRGGLDPVGGGYGIDMGGGLRVVPRSECVESRTACVTRSTGATVHGRHCEPPRSR